MTRKTKESYRWGFDDPVRDVHFINYDRRRKEVIKVNEAIRTARRYTQPQPLKIDKFFGDVEIPRNMISRVVGHLLNLNIQAELGKPAQKLGYAELLRREIEANPVMGALYLNNGGDPGIRYYLSGTGAKELIATLRG